MENVTTCDRPGPHGPCQRKTKNHKEMHIFRDDHTNKTHLWTDDWRPNPNRTTWRSE